MQKEITDIFNKKYIFKIFISLKNWDLFRNNRKNLSYLK